MFDVNKIREDFPIFRNLKTVYLDSAATSFKPQAVIDAVNEFYTVKTTNIHRGDYDLSYRVSREYDDVRKIIQRFIHAKDEREIVYTSGSTDSLNLVAYGFGLSHLKKGDIILTTLAEHASNLLPWFRVAEMTGAEIRYIPLNQNGSFNLEEYEKCFKENVKIVSMSAVSNVLGYVNPMKDIVKIAHEHGAVVNCDGAQSVPHIKTDVQESDVDFLSFSAHKMLGPGGVGVLYGKYELLNEMFALRMGGGSNTGFEKEGTYSLKPVPEKFEAGTPNIEGVLGLGAAARYLMDVTMEEVSKHDKELVTYFMGKLKELDNVTVYNTDAECSIVAFNVNGIFAQDAAGYFNKCGFSVRSGNHCAKVLHNVIKTNETIRASLYLYNTFEEIDKFVEVIKETTLEKCVESYL